MYFFYDEKEKFWMAFEILTIEKSRPPFADYDLIYCLTPRMNYDKNRVFKIWHDEFDKGYIVCPD